MNTSAAKDVSPLNAEKIVPSVAKYHRAPLFREGVLTGLSRKFRLAD